ncbi:glutamyl-tRNA amidotransferase [candidate division MSBL1 archaeon SCGC-AAA261D19]|uniref:Glutamyl-tRNA(Gln) amidotransferase subunit E n=1 Tax=candidate division MSBL1 archaeon SCGC-AAA261D19 TaxID=1698273 RepID=A0A133V8K6_9EURY|nr:glutamyl-tRNA amidotransferase [candidate division MSBL1 archaeon SCGC-AAA261D19]
MKRDYEELGLRVGLEIHQELDTHKLFCKCPSTLREEEAPLGIDRELRPTQSELGEIDRAALAEAVKGKYFRYRIHPDSVCLVEMDEEPPHPVNEEARDITLEIALLLNANPVDEAHVMRKTVIDGSNTAGFQRTILMATDGSLEVDGNRVSIPTICLEEDAARKAGEDANCVNYQLDRLGIPLVEIATGPDFNDPEMAVTTALKIGRILRATGKVKRGIGTIRQDINISIKGGARQEIKGIQELSLISPVIEREVERQLNLLQIRDKLERRGAEVIEDRVVEVTDVFSDTESRIIRRVLPSGGVFAVRLKGFAGLVGKELEPGRRFGTELADFAKVYGGVEGIFHTDELPGYKISSQEVEDVMRATGAKEGDVAVIVAAEKEKAKKALKAVIERANRALKGVPKETRRALTDGNTQFMRPLPGAARMYVETDIPPITIDREKLEKIKRALPELPEEKMKRYLEEFKLSGELARRMSFSEKAQLFEDLVSECDIDPTLVATTLDETLTHLKGEGVEVEGLDRKVLGEVFNLIARGEISKDALPRVLKKITEGSSPSEAVKELGLEKMGRDELEELISSILEKKQDLVKERGERAIEPLMGIVMKKVRGRADGKLVHEILERKLKTALE